MGKLAESLREGPGKDSRVRCAVADWINTLDEDDLAEWEVVLDDSLSRRNGWNLTKLFKHCAAAGLNVQANRLRVHVRGGCSCG